MVNKWIFNALSWILPPRCYGCDATALSAVLPLCPECLQALPRIQPACINCGLPIPLDAPMGNRCGKCLQHPPAFDRLIAATQYAAPLPAMIAAYKFNQQLHYARLFAGLIRLAVEHPANARPDIILPVPLHPIRQRQRSYNQALEITRILAQDMNIPLRHNVVIRQRHTAAQSNLDLSERNKNIRGAFRVTQQVHYSHIALLDDVVTTSNTVNEIARVLKQAGAKQVSVWCIARVS